jgi:molybdopterin-guanine dinucleotide biosynthesis protein A
MDAVVLAGGIPREGEPLYPVSQGYPKALLPVAGKPMAQWVLDALAAAQHVRRVFVVGLEGGLRFPRTINYLPNQGGFLDNILLGARTLLESEPQVPNFLLISSDIPAVTGPQIDWVIEQTFDSQHEFFYCVLEREVMEDLFPGCRRTFFRFRDRVVCGGDLAVIGMSIFSKDSGVWHKLTEARKSRWKTAAIIGFDVLLLFLLRLLTIDTAVRAASRRIGIRGTVLFCPYPEVGMDVDKPFQLDIVNEFLDRRGNA